MRRLNEVTTGEMAVVAAGGLVLAAWVWAPLGAAAALAHGWLAFALLLIALVDYRAFRIPDQLSLPLIPLGLVTVGWLGSGWGAHLGAAVAGAGVLYGVNRAYRALRGTDGLGLGDVKLTAAVGAWVGFEGLPIVILLASLGGIASFLLFRRSVSIAHDSGRAALPFGCYESLALLALVFWQTS